jgi:hypothetical protein
MRAAPSIFATEAYHRVSDKYQFIPTIEVVEAMRREGFVPIRASESRAILTDKKGFTRHMLRFRDVDLGQQLILREIGDIIPELVLVNGHDGSTRYQLLAGLFRLVCLNGMVASSGNMGVINVKHVGHDTVNAVIEGTYKIISEFPKIGKKIKQMQQIEVKPQEATAFARAALSLKYDDLTTAPVKPEQLLVSRRPEDNHHDVWTVFNRVQENMFKGGLHGISSTGRRVSTRAIKSVGEDVRLNKALWTLAEELAGIRQAVQ